MVLSSVSQSRVLRLPGNTIHGDYTSLRSHEIDDEGLAHTVHRPLLEAVPGLIAGEKDQTFVDARRGTPHMGAVNPKYY